MGRVCEGEGVKHVYSEGGVMCMCEGEGVRRVEREGM